MTFSRRTATEFLPMVMVAATILLVAVLTLHSLRAEAQNGVDHSFAVIEQAQAVLQAMTEAEADERGFLMGGDAAFLESYEDAKPRVEAGLARLRVLVRDEPEQAAPLEQADALTAAKLQGIAAALDGSEDGRDAARLRQDKEATEQIGTTLTTIIRNGQTRMVERRQAAAQWQTAVTTVSSLLLLGVIALAHQGRRHIIRDGQRSQRPRTPDKVEQPTSGAAQDFNKYQQAILGNLEAALQKTSDSSDVAWFLRNTLTAAEQAARLTGRLLASAPPQLATDATAPLAGQTVLLVESDETVRAATADQLTRLGYKVMPVDQGPAAVAVLDGGQAVDLLFTERFPAGSPSGRALAEAAQQRRPGLPVVFSSGYGKAIRAEEGGAVPSKPYRSLDLADAVARAVVTRPVRPAFRAQSGQKPAVLVVDDDELVRTGLCEMLKLWNYPPLEASHAEAALTLLAERPEIAFMITDLTLPATNGMELSRLARQLRPDLPIVLASGSPVSGSDLDSVSGAPLLSLTKPFRPDDLKILLERRVAVVD